MNRRAARASLPGEKIDLVKAQVKGAARGVWRSVSDVKATSRYAVLVGCNCPKIGELQGCVNDVMRMKDSLLHRFHFGKDNIDLLIDTDPAYSQPTGANIRESLQRMIQKASPGDVLLFYYSGYASRLPRPGHDNNTQYDDCIITSDMDYISDDFFRKLVNEVRVGVSFTIISDASHGGGLFGKEIEQIGASHIAAPPRTTNAVTKPRFIDAGSLNISPRQADDKDKVHSEKGILISGCQEGGRSVEVALEGKNEVFGAFSDALHQVLDNHPAPITNKDLVIQAWSILSQSNSLQQPCLYCSNVNAAAPFLHQGQQSREILDMIGGPLFTRA